MPLNLLKPHMNGEATEGEAEATWHLQGARKTFIAYVKE
jgi:hypothetical protein